MGARLTNRERGEFIHISYPCNENSSVLIAWIPVMNTGFPLLEFPQRENHVFITGMGLQCAR